MKLHGLSWGVLVISIGLILGCNNGDDNATTDGDTPDCEEFCLAVANCVDEMEALGVPTETDACMKECESGNTPEATSDCVLACATKEECGEFADCIVVCFDSGGDGDTTDGDSTDGDIADGDAEDGDVEDGDTTDECDYEARDACETATTQTLMGCESDCADAECMMICENECTINVHDGVADCYEDNGCADSYSEKQRCIAQCFRELNECYEQLACQTGTCLDDWDVCYYQGCSGK